MRDRAGVVLAPSAALWPPDDTEESVLGTSLHQTAIRNLIGGINEAAALATPPGSPVLWQAGGQTMLLGFRRPDGSAYTTLPDVFVYTKPWDDARGSLHLATEGPPVLIIEVLSRETYRADLDLVRGKGFSYADGGVLEYLTLDPEHRYVAAGGNGWRLEQGRYQPWRREADGRWVSATVPVAIALEGARVAVYASDGHRILREGEAERERSRLERRLAEERDQRQADLAKQQAVIEELRRRLEQLERRA